jgi:hypothetical protein
MKFRHLEFFVAAAEELNFTHAAARLNVSQPPFSKQIHDLEAELGIELFQRHQKGVALTAAGFGLAVVSQPVEAIAFPGVMFRELTAKTPLRIPVGAVWNHSGVSAVVAKRFVDALAQACGQRGRGVSIAEPSESPEFLVSPA